MSDLALSEFETEIEEMVEASTGPGRNCGRNAISFLRKAWELEHTDREMAVFRGLNAEEESASAVFNELREKKYKWSNKIEINNHVHKMALTPFLEAVVLFLHKQQPGQEHQIRAKSDNGRKYLELRIKVNHPVHGDQWVIPLPPLHTAIVFEQKPYDFTSEIQGVVNRTTAAEIKKTLIEWAKQRERLLYARPIGIPRVEGEITTFLRKQRRTVFTHLGIFLMIYPYELRQYFVQQTLQAFLKMLGLLEGEIKIE